MLGQIRSMPTKEGLRVRTSVGGRRVVGYASVFDSWATLARSETIVYREIIRPGAFRDALAERQNVVALFNHDVNQVLGRSSAGTLALREDAKGLHVEIDPPDTNLGRDVVHLVERGDLAGMSFAFRPRKGGSERRTRRVGDLTFVEDEVRAVDLFDVSVVTNPAYPDTTVALRSRGMVTQLEQARIRLARVYDQLDALEMKALDYQRRQRSRTSAGIGWRS
ncbi:HK97 family phage prohead protease [Paludisphaera rhizosphaerae]|uniref:HK97 family phage prohead protease n=1 Tax=Paludisphaera rhizosphaerae TaxID=2711216 RepID=UPI00197EA9F7|nr:HK97 family phage prohead protease [Paludisphaera rhizosphaerae]